MKQLFFTTVFSVLVASVFAQQSNFKRKDVEKSLVKINESLFASKYEVTNKQYTDFLLFLKQNNMKEQLNVAQIDSANWNKINDKEHPYVKYYHSHPAYNNYPLVNVSFEAALLYCDWLTQQYNSSKRKKYKKVKFRLPTEQEWIIAAKAGDQASVYAWSGNEFKNKKGEYRCNFKGDPNNKMGNASINSDRADVTATVNAYWPNSFGLYNMTGNVAEMIANKGITKGGSWLDNQEALKIESTGEYKDGDSKRISIGFRYFMEIIEE
jgi:formylglycine-generating enzyme required for sulfatase activity